MKKQLLFGAFLLSSILTANAQTTTVFSEDFNSQEFAFEGWGIFRLDTGVNNPSMAAYFPDTVTWNTLVFTAAPDNAFAASTSWFTDNTIAANRWLTTPGIAIPADVDSATLTFKDAIGDDTAVDGYELYISTTGNEVEDFTEAAVYTNNPTLETFTARTVDLSEFAGETVYIAWRHISTDGFLLFIDDVVVTTETAAGTEEFAASALSVFPNPATNVINVTNNEVVNGVQIVDLNGRVVKSAKVNATEAQINISDLSAGVYMMNIATDKGTTTKKIVKN